MAPGRPIDWIALNLLPGVGPITLRRALDRYRDPGEIAYCLSPSGWRSVRGFRDRNLSGILTARKGLRRRAEDELRECRRLGARVVPLDDPDYPAALAELPDAPILLYVRGTIPEAVTRVGVVGSRRASAYGRRIASGMAESLVSRGIEIVSGGARGIDSCAHRGALEGGGRTIAVLGSGLASPYPNENRELFDAMAESGAVVSEFPLDLGPKPEMFPRRNRLISGLSAAVVVVEAAARSGSLITASHALDQGREVMAVPGPVTSELSAGCHRLIQQGAKLVRRVDDILEELSPMYTAGLRSAPEKPESQKGPNLDDLSPDETAVLELLDDPEPVHIDMLAEKSPVGVARLQTALFGLEVRGAVEQLPGRYYLLRPRKPGQT